MRLFPLIPLLIAASFTACGGSRSERAAAAEASAKLEIQIKGSDTIVNLIQAWAEDFCKIRTDVNIGITGGGSGTGFAALLNHICSIAMSSREIEDKELKLAAQNGIKPVEHRIGLDGLIVIVHPSNPVSSLTLDQIRDIFMGRIVNWKQVGGEDRKIVILSRESNSGTHMFFKEHVLRKGKKKSKEEFAPAALLMPSSQAIVNEIVQNPNAVGYVGMGYLSPRLKALSISIAPGKPAVPATIANVLDNSYPISRPLFLYTDGEPRDAVKDFIDYALSDAGQATVARLDFVPIRKR
jgi:phosphate transport system substrate-binding protein